MLYIIIYQPFFHSVISSGWTKLIIYSPKVEHFINAAIIHKSVYLKLICQTSMVFFIIFYIADVPIFG